VSELVELAEPRFANRAALARYGAIDQASYLARYRSAERPKPVVNDLSFDGYRKHLLAMWDDGLDRTIEMASYDFDGEPWWATVQWADHPDGNGLAIVAAADITELKQVQAELEEVNRSKDRFVASISHELRTPLAAVVGFSSELVEHGEDLGAEETTQILSIIRDEAQEAAHLIEDLLVAARADMGEVTVSHDPIDLVAVVEAVQRSLHIDAPLLGAGAAAVICGDAIRVRQIVRNLVTNTQRYGGPHKELRLGMTDHSVVLEVCDDGTSLAQSDVERIFEPYATAHERTGRTDSIGLGLAVSRVLCELMHGSLSGARTNEGTVFRLELPRPEHCPDTVGVGVAERRPA
jgi:signal transduction histidine kinase